MQWTAARLLAAATALAMLLVAGCVSPYAFTEKIPARYPLTLAEATRLAGQAMQTVGYFATSQDERQGHIVGERQARATLDVDMLTIYLDVRFTPAGPGELEMGATCSVSKNIVYTDELDDECEKFRAAFRKALEGRREVQRPAAAPAPAVPPPPARPPARTEPVPPARQEYKL